MKFVLVINDKRVDSLRKKIDKNLNEAKKRNDKIMLSRGVKTINKFAGKAGFSIGVNFRWKWTKKNKLALEINSPAKDKYVEKSVIDFKKLGDIIINVVNDKGEVIKKL